MNKIRIYRVPSFNAVLTRMSMKVNEKRYKLKANEELEIETDANRVTVQAGTFWWKKEIHLDFANSNIASISVKINPDAKDQIKHFSEPQHYILLDEVNSEVYEKTKEQYKDLGLIKESIVNFIDVATLFFGFLIGVMYLMRTDGITDTNYLIIGATALAIFLSVVFRPLSGGIISQRSSLLRNGFFCVLSLLWYLQLFEIPGLVILGMSIAGFGVLWKASENMTLIQ